MQRQLYSSDVKTAGEEEPKGENRGSQLSGSETQSEPTTPHDTYTNRGGASYSDPG